MSSDAICKFYHNGQIRKFAERYEKSHRIETCNEFPCHDEYCSKRHPPMCKFFSRFGRCRFNSGCSYMHHDSRLESMKTLIESLSNEVNDLRIQNEAFKTTIPKIEQDLLLLKEKSNHCNYSADVHESYETGGENANVKETKTLT